MSLIADWQFAKSASVRCGYFFWLTGVALGADNVQTNVALLTLGATEFDHDGDVIYHGPGLGVVLVR